VVGGSPDDFRPRASLASGFRRLLETGEKPVSGVTGFWNLIPLVGFIIWVVKVQGALNRRWESAV
jgi:hypothetical protein